MTFGEMKDLIANRLGDTSTNTKDRIGEFINDIMFRISDDVQYPGERRWGQIRTETGRFSYPLEPDVGSVIEPMIVPENNANVWSTPVETFNANVQKPTSTGTPHNYMYYGNYGVERQPASTLTFTAETGAAYLTAEVTATIEGMVDLRNISESLTLATGVAAAGTTTNAFTTIDKISLSATPTDSIIVKSNGASSTDIKVARFTISETDAATSAYGLFNPGSKVYISSTATDANRKVTVTGYGPVMSGSTVLQDNIYIEEEISPTGSDWTTEKSSGNRYTTLESVTVDAESDGTFLIDADPITDRRIVSLPPKKRSLDIPLVGFYPIPDGLRINYQYYRTLTPLTIDSDRPPMDQRVHYYIRKWAETAVNQWYGDSSGVSETIQNALPSWRSDIQTIRNVLGLSANPEMVIGGRARSISRKYGPSAMLDPAHYSN
jgi:hypothetical protein